MKPRLVQLLLIISACEGLLAFASLAILPSEQTVGKLWGFSTGRLAVMALTLIAVLSFLMVGLWAFIRPRSWRCTLEWLDQRLAQDRRLGDCVVTLFFWGIAALAGLLFALSPLAVDMDVLRALSRRIGGLWLWLAVILLQTGWLLTYAYWGRLTRPGFFIRPRISRLLLLYLLILATGFHAWVFIWRESIFTGIKGWYWQFHVKPFNLRDLYWLGMTLLLAVGFSILFYPPLRWRLAGQVFAPSLRPLRPSGLIILILLGYLAQVSFGFVSGRGYESMRLKYADSSYKHYALHASDRPPILFALRNYEEKYGHAFSLKTKPPGALLVYLAVQRAAALFQPQPTFEGRFVQLTTVAAYFFPLLAMLTLIPLFYLSRWTKASMAYEPLFLYIVCPNVNLITLLLDQFWYPLLFLCGVLLTVWVCRRLSFPLAVVTGIYVYAAVYFSFSLLPLSLMVVSLMGLESYRTQGRFVWRDLLKLWGGFLLGLMIAYISFKVILNYDFFIRYPNALAQHREHKHFVITAFELAKSIFINNVEFSLWTGLPVTLLAFLQVVQSVRHAIHRRLERVDVLALAFLLTYIALNVLGQTRSEVGRLWLFTVPLVALLAASTLKRLDRFPPRWLALAAVLQWVTVFLTYHFQDFY